MASGLPLLSGPPPPPLDSQACRKCNKEFNILFSRSKQCYHCGYSYCSSCSDYTALLPKDNGYAPKPVCAFCIEFLTITASGKAALRSAPLSKLRKYVNAYNIRMDRAVEKDDLISAILGARTENGCLSSHNEEYYRRHSVPDRFANSRPRGIFARSTSAPRNPTNDHIPPSNNTPQHTFARPDLEPDRPYYAPPPGPPPPPRQSYPPRNTSSATPNSNPRTRTTSSTPPFPGQSSFASQSPPRPQSAYPDQQQYAANTGRTNQSQSPPTSPPRTAPRPSTPPSLDTLLMMSPEAISTLSVSVLKAILFTSHVNTGVGVLEKSELVNKVKVLVEDERRERARKELEEQREREMEEARRFQREEEERMTRESAEQRQRTEGADDIPTASLNSMSMSENPDVNSPPRVPPKMQAMAEHLERTGLCVICQDEEANIAIVDCGHLCLCRPCSDIIMANTRECPLCRTRIVTEARLLRIFKT